MPKSTVFRLLAILFAFSMIAAACGGDDEAGDDATSTDTETATAEPADTATAATATDTDTATAEPTDTAEPADETPAEGVAAQFEPRDAPTGEPIKIGFQNPEGDPAGSFPEYSAGAEAAVAYINAELGGLGGRPVELAVCTMAITPDDSQRCANELSADGVEIAFSSLNFFGNHFGIYQGSNIPVVVGTPITVGDFTAPGVFSIGTGGGCLGTHTGLVQFATQELPGITGNPITKVAVPWADTPPGVVCYYDLESKPLDVLNGTVPGDAALAGSMPDLEHIGVPVLPGQADLTAQATEVLDFGPDVIMFSGPGCRLLDPRRCDGTSGLDPRPGSADPVDLLPRFHRHGAGG
jgi:branched-chain amino acid transport system substrate-binding protein